MVDATLSSPSVQLVRLADEHLDATCRWLAESAELRARIDCLTPPTPEGNVTCWQRRWADPGREDYAIVHPQHGHVGNCGLEAIDLARRKAQLWIYLANHTGEGLGRQAVRALLQRGFAGLGLRRIELRVLADNAPAIALYRALGFVEEGRARCHTLRDGECVDALLFSMLAPEYRSKLGKADAP